MMKEYLKMRNNFVVTKNIIVPIILSQKAILTKPSLINNSRYVINLKNDINSRISTYISDTSSITMRQNKSMKSNYRTQSLLVPYETLISSIKESFMPLFGCSLSTLLKLLIILWLVGTLYQNELLPQDTGPVLSKLAYYLLLPSLLFNNVSQLLSNQQAFILFGITLGSFLQICIGYIMGFVCSKIINNGMYYYKSDLSFKSLKPDSSAQEIAAVTAAAMGNPKLAPVLLKRPTLPEPGFAGLVGISCAFGNSLTLPVIFLNNIFPNVSNEYISAVIAFFIIAWSPLFYSIGKFMLNRSIDSRITVISESELTKEIPIQTQSNSTKLSEIFTPPVISILAALLFSLSPLGPITYTNGISYKPSDVWEASLLYTLKICKESVILISSAAICVQTIILAVALFHKTNTKRYNDLISFLIPNDPIERRGTLLVALVRYVLMPLFGLVTVKLLSSFGLIPNNPICHLTLLVQSVMPPAQNITLLLNLNESTKALVPMCGRFLIRLYVLSIFPVTLWSSLFAALCIDRHIHF